MRADPSITTYSPATGASGKLRDLTAGADINSTLSNVGQSSFFWFGTAGATSIYQMSVHHLRDASLTGA